MERFRVNKGYIAFGFFLTILIVSLVGQNNLDPEINSIAKKISGNVGVYAINIKTGEAIGYNGDKPFPMQSVYKFPIAMAILDRVDKGKFGLNDKIHVDKSEYIRGHSPIRENFPEGIDLTINDLLKYAVVESDGTASDVLLRLLGGTKFADLYIHELGISDIAISTTEMVQTASDTVQYQNWVKPKAMTQLLEIFFTGKNLSENSKSLLLKYMTESIPGAKRLKGLLPQGTIVAHKTGTSQTIDGLTRATNDAGIITLPDGNHLAISVFISNSNASEKDRERTIAEISKAVFNYWKHYK